MGFGRISDQMRERASYQLKSSILREACDPSSLRSIGQEDPLKYIFGEGHGIVEEAESPRQTSQYENPTELEKTVETSE